LYTVRAIRIFNEIGPKTASAVFQKFVNKVFEDLIRDNKVIVYMGNIMIATDTDKHLNTLKEVFIANVVISY